MARKILAFTIDVRDASDFEEGVYGYIGQVFLGDTLVLETDRMGHSYQYAEEEAEHLLCSRMGRALKLLSGEIPGG